MSLVLRAGLGNRFAYTSLIAAEYCDVKVERVIDVPRVFVMETPDGPVSESNSMARYIAKLKGNNTLLGSSVYENAQIEQWMDFAVTDLDEGIRRWIYPGMGPYPHNGHFVQMRIGFLMKSLRILNTHLASGTYYLVSNDITLADIVLMCTLHNGFTRILPKSFTSIYPHVERYFWMFVNLPNFKKILGEVKQVESVPNIRMSTGQADESGEIERREVMVNQMIEAQKKSVNQIIQNGDMAY
ncbi:hypothetical protein LUZ60_004249 [Juncus effusus]|nr:hypothetical protein LUZ60_004249 [Juncus effusus]